MEKGAVLTYEEVDAIYTHEASRDNLNDETFRMEEDDGEGENDADTFFGFRTEMPTKETGVTGSLDMYDELNEETFGDDAIIGGDWDELHEQMMERDQALREENVDAGSRSDDVNNAEAPSHIQKLLEALNLQMNTMDNASSSPTQVPSARQNQQLGQPRSLGATFHAIDEVFDANATINKLPDFLVGSYGSPKAEISVKSLESERNDELSASQDQPMGDGVLVDYYRLLQSQQPRTVSELDQLLMGRSVDPAAAAVSQQNVQIPAAAHRHQQQVQRMNRSQPQRPEFDHWMSERDIETVKRIQQLQLHADQRHLCDPYGQILLRKKMLSESAVDVVSECDVHLKWYLLNMLMYRRPMEVRARPPQEKFEGALGRLLSSTVNNPKTLFDATKQGSARLSTPVERLMARPSLLLYHIEAMYDVWNEVELEMESGVRYVLAAINTNGSRSYDKLAHMHMLITHVLTQLIERGLHLDHLTFFRHYMAVQKGKELLLTMLPYWTGSRENARHWWTLLLTATVRSMRELIQSDKSHALLPRALPWMMRSYPLVERRVLAELLRSLQQEMFEGSSRSKSRSQVGSQFCVGLYVTLWAYLQECGMAAAGAPEGQQRAERAHTYDSYLVRALKYVREKCSAAAGGEGTAVPVPPAVPPSEWYSEPTAHVSAIVKYIMSCAAQCADENSTGSQ